MKTMVVRSLVGLCQCEVNLERWLLGLGGGCSWHATRCRFASIPGGPLIFDVSESEQGSSLERPIGEKHRFGINE